MRLAGTRGGGTLGWLVGLHFLAAATNAFGGEAVPGPIPPGAVSGSRLHAIFHDGGGGALIFRGWFDSELGVECVFTRTRSGQMRCLPATHTVLRDSTCMMPVWDMPASLTDCYATPPRYATALDMSVGGDVYELGEPYTGSVRTTSMGICLGEVLRGSDSYYGAGVEIPSERFVAAAIRFAPVDGGRFLLRTTEGDDGSSEAHLEVGSVFRAWWEGGPLPSSFGYVGSGRLRAPVYIDAQGHVTQPGLAGNFYDAEANAPCHPERFSDGESCAPRSAFAGRKSRLNLESSCTIPADPQWAPLTERVE
jgi:hypothetical protein